MIYYYITFARNQNWFHKDRHGITDMHKRVVKVKCADEGSAIEIANHYFEFMYSNVYQFWDSQDSKDHAQLGVTHELKYDPFTGTEVKFDLVELDKPEKV